MQRLLGAVWIVLVRDLEWAHHSLALSADSGRQDLATAVEGLLSEASKIPLRQPFVDQALRLQKYIKAGVMDERSLSLLASELREQLISELTNYLFFVVSPERKWMYLDPVQWFGPETVARFPEVGRDVRDACQCCALDQWTATVFHSMRILEHGLRSLASALTITMPTPLELENWKTILDQIERQIRAMEQLPKSAQKSEDVRFYSEAAAQFRYFKDAWRNHVSHSRSSYDQQDALGVLAGVRHFMAHLATRPRPSP